MNIIVDVRIIILVRKTRALAHVMIEVRNQQTCDVVHTSSLRKHDEQSILINNQTVVWIL
jgi:hypothetical protein